MPQPSSATRSRVQGGLQGGLRLLILMAGLLFTVSMVRCSSNDEMSALLMEWRRQRNRIAPHERDSRATSEAGGGSKREDGNQSGAGRGRSASLVDWRRRRSRAEPPDTSSTEAREAVGSGAGRDRPCGGGEHTDGRWVIKSAGEKEEGRPCCHYFEPDELFCEKTCVTSEGYHCGDWEDQYVWEPARCELAAWDAAAFCAALRGRSLMFIGDSTMSEVRHNFPKNEVHPMIAKIGSD